MLSKLTEREQMALRHCLDAVHRSQHGLLLGFVVGASAAHHKALMDGTPMPVARLHIAAARLAVLAERGLLVKAGVCRGPKGGMHTVYKANIDHPYWADPNHRLPER